MSKKLQNFFFKLIEQAIIAVKKNSNENKLIELKSDSKEVLLSIILNKLNKFYYYSNNNSDIDIFHLCSEIFFAILNDHPLLNGNKRVAFSFLIELLYYLGFYFRYTKGDLTNYEFNKDTIKNFIIDYQESKDIEQSIEAIYQWILKNIVVAAKFTYNFVYFKCK